MDTRGSKPGGGSNTTSAVFDEQMEHSTAQTEELLRQGHAVLVLCHALLSYVDGRLVNVRVLHVLQHTDS